MPAMNKPTLGNSWHWAHRGRVCEGDAPVRDAELVSVGSRTQSSASDFANAHGIAHAHPSYEALAQDPKVDVVYIATPHTQHFENTLLCLQAGKHVLCEKPFALNSAQVSEMVIAAKDTSYF